MPSLSAFAHPVNSKTGSRQAAARYALPSGTLRETGRQEEPTSSPPDFDQTRPFLGALCIPLCGVVNVARVNRSRNTHLIVQK